MKRLEGVLDPTWCKSRDYINWNWRCYAEVELATGNERKIMGNQGTNHLSDCWSNGRFREDNPCE